VLEVNPPVRRSKPTPQLLHTRQHPLGVSARSPYALDLNIKKSEAPRPLTPDRRRRVVHRQVPDRELLVADPDAVLSAVEDEVTHEPAGAVLHEQALVRAAGAHLDADVHQRRRLTDLPVKLRASGSGCVER
jgi:hypothetical protein